MLGVWTKPRLEYEALGLEGRELEIAKVIFEETEAERETRYQELPPISPEEAAQLEPPISLLGEPRTVGEARRAHIAALHWDFLLRSGGVISRCAFRARLDHLALVQFALDKCRPSNWEALFWYQQWIREALSDKVAKETLDELLKKKHEESAAAERRNQAARGGAGKAAIYGRAADWIVEQWRAEGDRWSSKKEFADAFRVLVKERFGIEVAASTITDVWLAPSRLAGM